MIIGIDIDGTINNLCESVLSVYNEDSGDNLTVDDITEYYIENFVKPEYKEGFHRYFMDKRVWKRVSIDEEARKYIIALHEKGHEIYFVTSTEPENVKKKAGWLQKNFPMINIRKQLIVCHNKQLLSGLTVLVDDYGKNLIGGHYHKLLLDKPWNQNVNEDETGIVRCISWSDVYRNLERLQKYYVEYRRYGLYEV